MQAYTEAIKEKGITLEDARAEADTLASKLFARAEKNWIEQHMDLYEEGFEKAKAAMMEYAQGKTSMVKAFTDQGLFAPPQELFPALAYAGRQMAAFGKTNDTETGTKMELRGQQNESFEYMKPFDEQVDDFMSEDRANLLERNSLLVSGAPNVFKDIGLPNLPVTIDQKHTGYALEGNYPNAKYRPGHIFAPDEFKKLPQKIADPIAIGYDPQSTKRVIIYVDMKNTTGQQVIVPLRIGGVANVGNNRIQALKLLTTFADEDGLSMLKSTIENDSNDHNTIFYLNKEKAAEVGTGDGMKTTVHFPSSGLIHKITDSGSPVKLEIQTQTDTKQFKQWFANSKVVNEDGTEKIMYHGTASEFWAFDLKKSNDKTGRLLGLGAGANKIYLTEYSPSAEMAARGAAVRTKNGQERVLGLYVSAQKVMDRSEYNRRLQEAYAKYPNSDPRGDNYDYRQRDKAIADVDRQVKAEGYDGVWDKESGEMFVYEPTQVKSATDNIGTFDRNNPDIRFSQRANAEDRQDRQALEDLQADADFYAQAMTDEETAEAVRLFAKIYRSLESLSNDLVGKITEREDWKYRKSEIAKRLITETGSKMKPKDVEAWIGRLFEALDKGGYNLGAEAAGNLVFEFRPTDRPFCCIVGKGDQQISGETEDVVLEVPKTFKEAAEFSFVLV